MREGCGQPGTKYDWNSLAMAYARLARETSDVGYYTRAEETLAKSFAIAPDNYEGLKVKAWLLLGRHEFAKAAELATKLNRENPDDVTVYGYLADAQAELGNYKEAVAAVQWMLNLRPGNVAGLTRAAYLRELHGDIDGALELMQMALDSMPFHETEDRAWMLTQMAHLHLLAGRTQKAEALANSALDVFPSYHYALGALAQVRLVQKRYADAVSLLQRRYDSAPHPENLFSLAEAQWMDGRKADASKSFAGFVEKARKEMQLADNANRELVTYYADYAKQPSEALRIAKAELARRHDVYALDSYAWALSANGYYDAAEEQIHKALATGLKDPTVLRHAAEIAGKAANGRNPSQ